MRNRFSKTLLDLAKEDENLFLLVGDIGFGVFDEFVEKYPNKFLNAGVAEANMIGTSAGLAMNNIKPIVYTIIPFLVMRTFEQIRNDICMHNLQVTLVGVGGGLSYESLGPTHHAIEDISIMRSIPNMQVVTPCDPDEVDWLFPVVYEHEGPSYFRLGKGGEKNLINSDLKSKREFGKVLEILKGEDLAIVSSGPILKKSLEIAESLEKDQISSSVINVHILKPFNEEDFISKIANKKLIVTLEEHSIIGGLGDVISNALVKIPNTAILLKIGIEDKFITDIGDRDYQMKQNGMGNEEIIMKIKSKLKNID